MVLRPAPSGPRSAVRSPAPASYSSEETRSAVNGARQEPMGEESIKFLVAEDEPAVRSFLCAVLEEHDHRNVAVALDGQDALQKIRAIRPDVLITDIKMPRMDGEELSRKALELVPDLTILVTTGNATIESAVRMMKSGI